MAWTEPFVFFGSSDFSCRLLAGIMAAGCSPALVVSSEDKIAGRGLIYKTTPLTAYALERGWSLLKVKSFKTSIPAELINTGATFGLLAAFGKIIPAGVIEIFDQGIVNVHPSLLPLYRGPAPIQAALKDGATETGVSLIILDEEVDHGPILAQQRLLIKPEDDAISLSQRLAQTAVELLLASLPRYLAGELTPLPQDHQEATFTKRIVRLDGWTDFSQTAQEINNLRRAFTSWPGLWTSWRGQRLKIINTSPAADFGLEPGQVAASDGDLVVGCAYQTALLIKKIQLAGGQELLAADFIRGHKNLLGDKLPS